MKLLIFEAISLIKGSAVDLKKQKPSILQADLL